MSVRRLLALFLMVLVLGAAPVPQPRDELVMFEQQGCPYCAAWNREVGTIYAKTDEGHKLPLRRVDIADPRPADLRSLKRIVATPTFVLMHCGSEFDRIIGYIGQDQFWGLLDTDLKALAVQEKSSGSSCNQK
jgi:thioredoxin-related protein